MWSIVFLMKVSHPSGKEDYFLERPEKAFSDETHAMEIVQDQMGKKYPLAREILIRGYVWEKA